MTAGFVGAARTIIEGEIEWPIHALRHPPSGDSTGWFLWTGELSDDESFFQPWHLEHLLTRVPDLAPHLDLEPGSRFIFAPDYFDVWFDPSLLEV